MLPKAKAQASQNPTAFKNCLAYSNLAGGLPKSSSPDAHPQLCTEETVRRIQPDSPMEHAHGLCLVRHCVRASGA